MALRRTFFDLLPDELLKPIAAAATVPVVNARSDQHNPCEALADPSRCSRVGERDHPRESTS